MPDDPAPQPPRFLTTGQVFQLKQAALSVAKTLERHPVKEWNAGERHLYKRCVDLLAVIVDGSGDAEGD